MAAKKKKRARKTAGEALREYQATRGLTGAEAARTPEGRAFITGKPVNRKPNRSMDRTQVSVRIRVEHNDGIRRLIDRQQERDGTRLLFQDVIDQALRDWLKKAGRRK